MIRNVKLEDIKELAPIYKDLYDDADIGEFWTVENAEKLLGYFYDRQYHTPRFWHGLLCRRKRYRATTRRQKMHSKV